MLGLHPVRVALHPEVVVTVTANVAKSADEAELQKKAGGFIPPTTEGGPTLDEMIAAAEEVIGDAGDGEAPAEAEAAPEAKPEKEKKPKAEKKAKKKKKGDEEEDED
jgi:large subunit ribosomal protein L9